VRIFLVVEGQEGVGWEEWVSIARGVEAAGLDGLFRSDHYTSFQSSPDAALDAWATIAGLAATTDGIRLGTLVTPATFRPPSELARVVVTADHISGGRVELGIGAGWFENEHRQNGFPFPPTRVRFSMLEEYVQILLRSWSAEEFDFRGAHFDLVGQRALPAPLQRPHPPLIFGGRGGPRSIALAAKFGDEYSAAFLAPHEAADLRGRLDVACRAIGREPATLPLSMMTLVAAGRDARDAEDRLSRMLLSFRVPPERCYSGVLDEVEAALRGLEAAGVTRIYSQHPYRQDFASIQLLGQLAAKLAA
jgi:alkanesulfonate monooxygenase SsuD/methylene tetrahydromethanopterin reductase-like flavin-dependent oxidoreductase (luciferase family)